MNNNITKKTWNVPTITDLDTKNNSGKASDASNENDPGTDVGPS